MSVTIDVHHHILPDFFWRETNDSAHPVGGIAPPVWDEASALAFMDDAGIDVAITSISTPGVHVGDDARARRLARRCNDYAGELAMRWPKRFGAFATVPMWDMREATAEIDYALGELKHQGVCLFASYGEKFLGDKQFDPVMEALNARAAIVFVHPALHPSSRMLELPWPGFMMEYVFDTTRAAVNLVFSGAVERFPRIRFVLAHAGGLMPYFAWRLSISPMIDARLEQLTPADIYARLGRFWYDNALSPTAETLTCLNAVAPPNQIVFGSDWPFANARVISEAVKTYEAVPLPQAQREAIDRGNALSLFPQWA